MKQTILLSQKSARNLSGKTLEVKNAEEDRDDYDKYLVSDRRWKKIVGLLRMCAYINGRKEVNLSDCVIIPYCLWSTEIQVNEIFEIVADLIIPVYICAQY